MKATIFDVAKEAGVSISTVSNALTGKKNVSAGTRARIDAAVRKLGYSTDPAASSLKSRNSHIIGLIVPSIDSAFFPAVISGLQSVLEENGYIINFYATGFNAAVEEQYIQTLLRSRADGIILDSVSTDRNFLRSVTTLGGSSKSVPVIALERDLTDLGLTSIYADNYSGGKMAAAHLIQRGAKRIAHIIGLAAAPWSHDRHAGYRDALAEAGLPYIPELIVQGDFSLLGGYRATGQLLASGEPFDGIFAANDLMAVGVIKALNAYGIRVPEDVCVAGFDNTYVAALTTPPVTTIDIPKYQLGVQAGEAVIRAMESGAAGEKICLPLRLMERRSSNMDLPAFLDEEGIAESLRK
ncbi:MAG: LacI family DNA-binding transcriptional regulator [Clostridia bacterium]|nr:LacI family DNA-binding transcriptional regulator [Clostridia bacterium]